MHRVIGFNKHSAPLGLDDLPTVYHTVLHIDMNETQHWSWRRRPKESSETHHFHSRPRDRPRLVIHKSKGRGREKSHPSHASLSRYTCTHFVEDMPPLPYISAKKPSLLAQIADGLSNRNRGYSADRDPLSEVVKCSEH